MNGIKCSQPSLYISLNKATLANLYPTTNKTAAKQASGIWFKTAAKATTLINKSNP